MLMTYTKRNIYSFGRLCNASATLGAFHARLTYVKKAKGGTSIILCLKVLDPPVWKFAYHRLLSYHLLWI